MEAARLYEQCFKEFEDVEILMKLAYVYGKRLAYNEDNYYKTLVRASEYDHPEAHYQLSHYYKKKGEMTLYRRHLEAACKLRHVNAKKEYDSLSDGQKSHNKAVVNSRCNLCMTCILACPLGLIQEENGKLLIEQADCIGCGECVRACSRSALRIMDLG